MYEIIKAISPGQVILDLGSQYGSFPQASTNGTVVRLDRNIQNVGLPSNFICADAAQLPIRNSSVSFVVANHSLEHFDRLADCLKEIGRVIESSGALFVAIPDASTFTDKLYRWLSNGGGHINAFTNPGQLVNSIEQATGLPHVATKTLYSSLCFLNRRNSPTPRPRRQLLIGGGSDLSLLSYTWLSRRLDRIFNLRTSVYGWAFYFGSNWPALDLATFHNVCIRCGSATPSASLTLEKTWFGIEKYHCVFCGSINTYCNDSP